MIATAIATRAFHCARTVARGDARSVPEASPGRPERDTDDEAGHDDQRRGSEDVDPDRGAHDQRDDREDAPDRGAIVSEQVDQHGARLPSH